MASHPTPLTVLRESAELVGSLLASGDYYMDRPEEPGQKSVWEAAQKFGKHSASTYQRHISVGLMRFGISPLDFTKPKAPSEEELDDLPDGYEVLTRHASGNTKYIKSSRNRWRRLIPVKKEPFAVAFFGDIHAENKGTNLDALLSDMRLVAAAGVRAVNMGDILDNFHLTGKLAPKQASNRMSVKEALAAARYIVRDSDVDWIAHILGNHDAWAGDTGAALLQSWGYQNNSRFYDWICELTFAWDGGEYKVLAAHDFPGSSVYNPLHALQKRALNDGAHDLYVAGHRHTAADAGIENAYRGKKYKFMRVRGYKDWDDYAHRKGYDQQVEGRTGVAVIDPHSETMDGRCRLFMDVESGLEFLAMLRARA